MVQMIAAARKRGRWRSASNTRLGSKKIPVRVCAVDIVTSSAPVADGGGTKSWLLGSLIIILQCDRGRGDHSVRLRKSFGRSTFTTRSLFHPEITCIPRIKTTLSKQFS